MFTLLTFPLRCTLDIEQCGRGRLFSGPFANEAIKSILPWLSEGQGRHGKSSAVSANTERLRHPAVRIHNRLCRSGRPFGVVASRQCDSQQSRRSRAASGHIYPCGPAVVNRKEIKRLRCCLRSACEVSSSHRRTWPQIVLRGNIHPAFYFNIRK